MRTGEVKKEPYSIRVCPDTRKKYESIQVAKSMSSGALLSDMVEHYLNSLTEQERVVFDTLFRLQQSVN